MRRKLIWIPCTLFLLSAVILGTTLLLIARDRCRTPPSEPIATEDEAIYPYEYYLAASVLTGIYMDYQDPVIHQIYLASKTSMQEVSSSNGIYITFASEGTEYCIHSMPLLEEPNILEDNFLHTENFGYASYEMFDPSTLSENNFFIADIETVQSLVSELEMLTIY